MFPRLCVRAYNVYLAIEVNLVKEQTIPTWNQPKRAFSRLVAIGNMYSVYTRDQLKSKQLWCSCLFIKQCLIVYNIVRLINEYHIIEFIGFIGFHLSVCRLFCLLFQLFRLHCHLICTLLLLALAHIVRINNIHVRYTSYSTQDKCAFLFVCF